MEDKRLQRSTSALSTTLSLIEALRAGDRQAAEQLRRRYFEPLQRWTRGRLPAPVRAATRVGPLARATLLAVLRDLERSRPASETRLESSLRQAILDRIQDERGLDGLGARGEGTSHRLTAEVTSPLEEAIGRDTLALYDQAIQRLDESDRYCIIARIELGFDYDQIAAELGEETEAAKTVVSRALLRLAEEMGA